MSKEYALIRKQWLDLLLAVVSAPDEDRDELFREAVLLFAHMRRQKWEGE